MRLCPARRQQRWKGGEITVLVNLSNHPSPRWSAAQAQAAAEMFGEVRDLPFPAIDPRDEPDIIAALAKTYVEKTRGLLPSRPTPRDAVHVMGEMTFVFQFVRVALLAGCRCVASTTERVAIDHPGGAKTSEFRFVRFRDYAEI